MASQSDYVECPICGRLTRPAVINDHIDSGCTRNALSSDTTPMQLSSSPQHASPTRTGHTDTFTSMHSIADASHSVTRKRTRSIDESLVGASPSSDRNATPATPPPAPPQPPQPVATTLDKSAHVPLAERLRPRTLDQLVGQEHLLGQDGIIRQLILSDRVPSMILWGPPGTGKTSIARTIAEHTQSIFRELSGVVHNVSDLREAFQRAKRDRALTRQSTILFVDEIHRLNRGQQDLFLPQVEQGVITLIGATTENPSFRLCSALLSRCRVFTLHALEAKDIRQILEHGTQQLLHMQRLVSVAPEALDYLADVCNGDARIAIQSLQIAADASVDGQLTHKEASDAIKRSHLLYDQSGEEHYNTISAYIKSMRGSDPNAAMYWLMRMLEGGEDPLFIARRLLIFASEDVGLADVSALSLAVATQQACQTLGRPECDYALSHCTIYMAETRKSVRVKRAMQATREEVKHGPMLPVPLHLRNAPTQLMKHLGYGRDYIYPPDVEGPVDQQYLPPELQGRQFVEPKENET